MSYEFRNTTKVSANLYIEDAGYERQIKRGDVDFATVDAKFGSMLSVGQTALRDGEDDYIVVDGFPMLEEAKAAKLHEINDKCQRAMATITESYPANECLTFDQQKAEALAYQADSTASCPMLRALAKSRGMELAELARRVLVKAEAFSALSGTLMGQRQAYEDLLESYSTPGEVQKMIVAYHN